MLAVAESLDFGVRQARAPVPAASDDFSTFQENRADYRVRRSQATRARREAQRLTHESKI
jgi:hypothetical protein